MLMHNGQDQKLTTKEKSVITLVGKNAKRCARQKPALKTTGNDDTILTPKHGCLHREIA